MLENEDCSMEMSRAFGLSDLLVWSGLGSRWNLSFHVLYDEN